MNLLESYLQNRLQYISINNKSSSENANEYSLEKIINGFWIVPQYMLKLYFLMNMYKYTSVSNLFFVVTIIKIKNSSQLSHIDKGESEAVKAFQMMRKNRPLRGSVLFLL